MSKLSFDIGDKCKINVNKKIIFVSADHGLMC